MDSLQIHLLDLFRGYLQYFILHGGSKQCYFKEPYNICLLSCHSIGFLIPISVATEMKRLDYVFELPTSLHLADMALNMSRVYCWSGYDTVDFQTSIEDVISRLSCRLF